MRHRVEKIISSWAKHARIKRMRRAQAVFGEGHETRRIIFVHIPKCGGSSLRQFLTDRFEGVRLDEYRNETCWDELVEAAKTAPLVYGHFGAETLQEIRGNAFVFTIMRDPRERQISQYRYLASFGSRMFPSLGYVPSLNEYLAAGLSNNLVTRQLAKTSILEKTKHISGEDLLAVATETLCSMDAIGFQETLNESVSAICDAAGILYADGAPIVNITPDGEKPQVDNDVMETSINLDRKLYRIAQAL